MINIEENKGLDITMLPPHPKHFIKIPKEIILNQELSEHRVFAFLYLIYNQTLENNVHYSSQYMIQWCGYKPVWNRSRKENIHTKFKDCMNWFLDNEYISEFDEKDYTQSKFQTSSLNVVKIRDCNSFASLYDFEIDVIKEYVSQYKPLTKSLLILTLSYIRAHTWIRKNEVSGHSEKSKKAKPEMFHSTYTDIGESLGISRKMVSRIVTVLEELNLIKTKRMPKYKTSDETWHTDDIIFVCPYKYVFRGGKIRKCSKEEYNPYEEIVNGMKFLMEQKKKKFEQN